MPTKFWRYVIILLLAIGLLLVFFRSFSHANLHKKPADAPPAHDVARRVPVRNV